MEDGISLAAEREGNDLVEVDMPQLVGVVLSGGPRAHAPAVRAQLEIREAGESHHVALGGPEGLRPLAAARQGRLRDHAARQRLLRSGLAGFPFGAVHRSIHRALSRTSRTGPDPRRVTPVRRTLPTRAHRGHPSMSARRRSAPPRRVPCFAASRSAPGTAPGNAFREYGARRPGWPTRSPAARPRRASAPAGHPSRRARPDKAGRRPGPRPPPPPPPP